MSLKRWYFVVVALFISVLLIGCGINNNDTRMNDKNIINEKITNVDEEVLDETLKAQEDQIKDSVDETQNSLENKANQSFYSALEMAREQSDGTNEPIMKQLLLGFYSFYFNVRMYVPLIFVASEVIGLLFVIFAKGNKGLRKFGLFGLMIGLPVLLIVYVFGVGYLMNVFLT